MFKFLLVLLAGGALTASASTVTFQPTSQTVNLGGTATVNVLLNGLTAGQAIGAFDLLVNSNSSIIMPTSVTFFNALGDPALEYDAAIMTAATADAAEISFETTATLLALQDNQPFSLFSVTYNAVGVGTSALTLGSSPEYLADGSGTILPNPSVVNGSITVTNGTMTVTPEPSSLVLLATGLGAIGATVKRRLRQR